MAKVELRSPEVVKHLSLAGWTEKRRVNIDQWVAALESESYQCHPFAREFLEKFGRLKFTAQPSDSRRFNPGDTEIEPLPAAEGEFDRVDEWQKNHNLRLCPVGSIFDGYSILLATPDGSFYGGSYDNDLVFIAADTDSCFMELLYAPWELVLID